MKKIDKMKKCSNTINNPVYRLRECCPVQLKFVCLFHSKHDNSIAISQKLKRDFNLPLSMSFKSTIKSFRVSQSFIINLRIYQSTLSFYYNMENFYLILHTLQKPNIYTKRQKYKGGELQRLTVPPIRMNKSAVNKQVVDVFML